MAKSRNPNGQGTYFKKGERFCWRQKIDGKARELSAKTPKELQTKINKIIDTRIIKDKCKVDDWFERWLESYVKPMKKQATYEQYNYIYQGHIKPAIGKRNMQTIESIDIQGVIASMNKKNMAAKTMKHAKSIMHLGFEKAFKDKVIAKNPVIDIEIPKKQAKPQKTLSPEEVSKLIEVLKTSRWIHSVRFMLVTGLRRGEMLALKWSDIDEKEHRITVSESNSRAGVGDTKSAKVHYVPLCKKAILYLNEQRRQLETENNPILLVDKLKKSNLIFPNDEGVMLKANSYYNVIARAAKKAEIHVSPHCFRHTFVYSMRHKLSLKQLQEALGHDESTTTLDIYGDMINDEIEETANTMDVVFANLDLEVKKIEEKHQAKIIQFPMAK